MIKKKILNRAKKTLSTEIKEIQNLIKFVAKSGASEVKLEMGETKITIKTIQLIFKFRLHALQIRYNEFGHFRIKLV